MKKFTSIFLIISMIMCNLNTGLVEALSDCCNEVKSLVNTEKEKTVGIQDDKVSGKETTQVLANDKVKSSEVTGSINQENVQALADNSKAVDLKDKNQQVKKLSDKKSYASDNEGNVQENVILMYNIATGIYYHYIDKYHVQELYLLNEKSTVNKNKQNLNDLLANSKFTKSEDGDLISDAKEVTLVITGVGSDASIEFDNDGYDVPFNIVFYKMQGRNCSFSFENIKSMYVIDNNTIENSSDDNTALKYSFNDKDLSPLKIADNSSFIVYNREKDIIDNNIVYSGVDSGNNSEDSGDNSEDSGDNSKNSGYSSIVNISLEKDNLSEEKKFILQDFNNKATSKQLSFKNGYSVLSILLISDNNNYILKEEGKEIPYYYRTGSSIDENNEIFGQIGTKIVLNKNSSQSCYNASNDKRVEVVATEADDNKKYYLVNTLEEAMDNGRDLSGATIEFIFLGDYEITQNDIGSIKEYNKNIFKIIFKTKVDDWIYLLNVNEDIELMNNNINQFYVIFKDIRFNYKSNGKWIYANGRKLTFEDNVDMEGGNYPSVSFGGKTTLSSNFDSTKNNSLIIYSGKYDFVTGDCNNTLQNVDVNIYGGNFKNKVSGVSNNSQNNNENNRINNVTLTIRGGIFNDKVIIADGKLLDNANLTIIGGTFNKEVIGINGGEANNTTLKINNGTFRNEIIGINGGKAKSVNLIINKGNFNSDIIGASSSDITEKITLKGLLNRYSFINNVRTTNNQEQVESSGSTGLNINIDISGGTFKGNLIGNGASAKDKATINILGNNITIVNISNFDKLAIGSKTKKATLTVEKKLDKASSIGNLYLNKGSKVSFKNGKETSKLNNIELYGDNNTLVVPTSKTVNTTKNTVLIELSGDIIKDNANNKLSIESKSTTKKYLIRFTTKQNADVTDKYYPQNGYYVCDEKDENGDLSGYVLLCPQTIFDLKYDLSKDKLYMIDESGNESGAWWYNGKNIDSNISLNTVDLYQYKGYNLFKGNIENRDIILTGNKSNKNITVNNNLNNVNNVNVVLNGINLTDSRLEVKNIKSLKLDGENTIKSINVQQPVFNYVFNNSKTSDKVLFGNGTSYLKIFTNEDTKPFNTYEEDCIDFKFFEPFKNDTTVRLKNNNNIEYKFEVPNGTQRLGVLVDGSCTDTIYNLYYGKSDETGSSVYVSGNTDYTFRNSFTTLSNNEEAYDYVRRANPVKSIQVDIPNPMSFEVNTQYSGINGINKDNWNEYFKATDMVVKNNSIIIKDQFTHNGNTQSFGEKNLNLEFGYLGVTPSVSYNDIKLISKDKLSSDITNCKYGVNLALKFLSEYGEEIPIDEENRVMTTPLNKWIVSSGSVKTLKIVPDFDGNNHFFNVNKNAPELLTSSHKFIFRFGLKDS